MTNIQRIIDALSEELERPTAVDDSNFRLLFYSPQVGALDPVRVASILHREAPGPAKDWVRAQGVADAIGVHRLGGAPSVGLLPRTYVPIRHEGRLLGYLWIIDADENLTARHDEVIAAAAAELAPLLYRRRTLDLLDRQGEHEAVRDLLFSEDPTVRSRSADCLQARGVLAAGTRPSVVVIEALVDEGQAFNESEQLGLEATLERRRGLVADADMVHVAWGTRGAIVIADRAGRASGIDVNAIAQHLADDGRGALHGRRVVVGIGSPREHLLEAHASYREALDVTRMLARVERLGDVLAHDDLGVYAVIAQLPDSVLAPDLVPAPVRALLEADKDGDLIATLEAFLDRAGDVVRVARDLHMHRSTVYTRVRRLEMITGCSLDDGRSRLVLHVGLSLARVVGLWPRRPG